ncbi:MFS transporter [Saccharophagus degradans]|uniref:MFS transporter n=1 Tax=Saccharophagus degradans TaxID=86304 RepID=A0AAW7X898_9GAMM|nr:MFS transporter [Saccharophagus degradans]MDO6423714.1 MFS transporter [Saccharophagus degradans]MDO6607615.1 MFS transporter [Saccharophagus degradans]
MLSLPRNVWVLACTISLTMAGISLLMLVGGLIGAELAPSSSLATLPIAAFVVGMAASTIPATMILKRFGRKAGTYFGFSATLLAALCAITAVNSHNFWLMVCCGLLIGTGTAFYQQFRFAAIESLSDPSNTGPALSALMLFNIVGALIGPELGTLGRHMLSGYADYTGSFLLLIGLILLAMLIFSLFKNPIAAATNTLSSARPLKDIVRQPLFIIALISAGFGYGLMSFLMTSTPLSMHTHHGYSLADAKWVIQSHLVAMFLPSLFSGFLLKKLGEGKVMLLGGILYGVVILVAFAGQALMHYWWALVLLGVGWNFLFLSGTSLLPKTYKHEERFKAQAVNDFIVFTVQATAALSAAWVLFEFGWHTQVAIGIPLTVIIIIGATVLIRQPKNTEHKQPN